MNDVPNEEEDVPDVHPDDPEVQKLYFQRLRGRYPKETAALASNRLMEIVRVSLKKCPPLRIRKPYDVLRFLALGVLRTPEQEKSKFLDQVVRQVLESIDSWSAGKRLDFIYKHVVGRPPPNPEPDFGPWFVEVPAPE